MKKNGFTLVEIMGVIILLSLILLVAFPAIVGVVKRSDNKINEANKALIISAAKNYVNENKNTISIPTTVNSSKETCITIQTLIDEQYLIEDLEQGSTGEKIDTQEKVAIIASKKEKIVNLPDGTQSTREVIEYDYYVPGDTNNKCN